jgi:hypothetical protein
MNDEQFVDLNKISSRQFIQQVGNNNSTSCVGRPDMVLYNNEYRTIYLVYMYQSNIFDFDSNDNNPVLQEFEVNELPELSFDSDKTLIEGILL